MADNPFRVRIFNRFTQVAPLGDLEVLEVTPAHNAVPVATITLRQDHHRIGALMAEGARVRIDYDGQLMMTGMVRLITGRGPSISGTIDFRVDGDLRLLWGVLGWPRPDQPITNQGVREDKRTGPAETVAKDFIRANVQRLGLPVTVAPDQGRGATVTVTSRMALLGDRLYPAIDQAGIGLSIVQSGQGFVVDAYTPVVKPVPLTEQSGVVASWAWTREAPSMTRAVVGDDGVGATRGFRLWPAGVTTGQTTLEALWGDKIESFVDAGDTNVGSEMEARGKTAVDDAGVKAGLEVTLSETEGFRYGQRIRVGDRVTIKINDRIQVTDILRKATIRWARDTGVVIAPEIGEQASSTALIRMITSFGRAIRTIRAR